MNIIENHCYLATAFDPSRDLHCDLTLSFVASCMHHLSSYKEVVKFDILHRMSIAGTYVAIVLCA